MLQYTYFAGYGGDNSPYTVNEKAGGVIRNLVQVLKSLLKCFKDVIIKLNPDSTIWYSAIKAIVELILETLSLKICKIKNYWEHFLMKKILWIWHWKHVYKGLQETTGIGTYSTIHASIKKKFLVNAFWISNLATVPLYQCVKAIY